MPTPPLADAQSPPRRRMRVRDLLLPIGLSVTALAIVYGATHEPGAFEAVAQTFRPGWMALALAALVVQTLAGGLRLRHVSHRTLGFKQGLRAQLTWDFMSAVTPSAMGGAPFAAFFIARENRLPYGEVTAVMLFTMLMDQVWFATLIVTMYVSAIWLPVFPTSLGAAGIGTVAAYLAGMLCWIGFFAYATLVRPELIEKAAAAIVRIRWLRRFEDTVRTETRKLRRQARVLRGQPVRFYAKGALFTITAWLGRYSVLLFVVLSFTRDVRPLLVMFRAAGLWLSGLAMPTPGGSGGIEGLFVLFVGPLLPPGYSGPVVLAWRLLAYYLLLTAGLFVAGGAVRSLLRGDADPAAAADSDADDAPPLGGDPEAMTVLQSSPR